MSDKKGHIVMNMPEGCWQCGLKYFEPRWKKAVCAYTGECVDLERPDGCPIRPMPERYYDTSKELFKAYWEKGWNACLDAIEGEAKEEEWTE